jgi:hypothetical protein
MEYVDGKTLRVMIEEGTLSMDNGIILKFDRILSQERHLASVASVSAP